MANTPQMPEVTEAHRLAAFQAMRWRDCDFQQAMANDIRRRVIECRAHQIRTREWVNSQRKTTYVQSTGSAQFLRAKPGRRFSVLPAFDGKRAAAGDFDD